MEEDQPHQAQRLSSRKSGITSLGHLTMNSSQQRTASSSNNTSLKISNNVKVRTQNIQIPQALLTPLNKSRNISISTPASHKNLIASSSSSSSSFSRHVSKRITIPKVAKLTPTLTKTGITNLSKLTCSSSNTKLKTPLTKSIRGKVAPPPSTRLKQQIIAGKKQIISVNVPTSLIASTTSSLLYDFEKSKNDEKSLVNQCNQSIVKLNNFINLLKSSKYNDDSENMHVDFSKYYNIDDVVSINRIIKLVTVTPMNNALQISQEQIMLINLSNSSSFSKIALKEAEKENIQLVLSNYFKLENGMKMYYNFKVKKTFEEER